MYKNVMCDVICKKCIIATDEDEGKKLNGKVNDIEKEEHQKLKQQNEDLLKQHEEEKTLKKEVETLNQKITGLLSQLEENKREVERLNHQIKGKIATDEDEGKKLEGKVNDIKKENQELKQQNKDLLKKQSEEEKTLKKEVETLNQKITGLLSQLEENKREVERLNHQIKANDEDKEKKTEGKLNEKTEENQELKQLNEGAFPQNHGLVIQVKPWKTVKRLKEILTMDEASVKGDLEVDSWRKSVKCTKLNRNETLNAMSTYILCKETFSSGQHFWEVNVNDKQSWFVGVCSNTLRGQHGVSLTPQNGCWLLCYDKHQGLFVNTDPKITSVQEENKYQFKRLGVFLDCCRHSLTFYDGVSLSCLCTICDVGPTLPLVPVFSPGVRDLYEVQIMN
ncbi:E3 ubiquitin-protein ligase TRIM39-like [Alosa alosa]|uniref:E3 ubiquitin-protein ligase TRIM39-like n=1 Tax=Alosa alosa TaxID=278164 RepID=UPI0020153DDC|nr:E3 ubiquitin-protein ligase TRIM39-like [Alosa alosa]